MVDLAEFVGDVPERRRLVRFIEKAQERLDKLMGKVTPLQADIAMYQEMIAAIDKRSALCPAADADQEEQEIEEKPEIKIALTQPGDSVNVDFHQVETAVPAGNIVDNGNVPAFLRKPAAQ